MTVHLPEEWAFTMTWRTQHPVFTGHMHAIHQEQVVMDVQVEAASKAVPHQDATHLSHATRPRPLPGGECVHHHTLHGSQQLGPEGQRAVELQAMVQFAGYRLCVAVVFCGTAARLERVIRASNRTG